MGSIIQDFYRNKSVLLTGGTGFLGKMITEKLLRTTEIKRIYVIVREKQGVPIEKRVSQMFEEEIFDKVREKKTDAFSHICAIQGDLTKKGLGLTETDKETIKQNVNIVFHCGASLNMNGKLSDAIITNVGGTAEIIEILKDAANLNAFILVSTAYSNCSNTTIEEKFYEPTIDPELLIKMAEEISPGLFNNFSKGLTADWPNSYVFSKAVTENLLLKKRNNLPAAIFRPTIVTSTVFEPVPGWTDNLYGPLGILLSQHCGILRVVRGHGDIKADTVPGDMVINALLCFAWDVKENWSNNKKQYVPLILNFSGRKSALYLPIREYVDQVAKSGFPPLKKAIWHPMLFIANNFIYYNVLKFALHTVPAYIFDMFLMAFGQKSRMNKIYAKLDKLTDVFHYFLTNEWKVENRNSQILWDKLNDNDKKIYNFDLSTIERHTYFKNILTGLKQFILKEDMSGVKYHKQKHKRLSRMHHSLIYLLIALISYRIGRQISSVIQYIFMVL